MAKKFDLSQSIIFEDHNYMLINKPPFISTLEDRHEPFNILQLAREIEPDAQVCHRLDKNTSGILAIAKNPEAYRHLSLQFEHRETEKIYHAVVDGRHQFENTEVDLPLEKLPDATVRISRQGKPSLTFFNALQIYMNHTLVECKPVTGRMHQIRVHLSHLGAPITGDELYGGKPFFLSSVKRNYNLKKSTDERPIMQRMALHAHSLAFKGLNDDQISVSAPYPKDFAALIRQLEQNKR